MSSDEPMLPWEEARTAQRKRAALALAGIAILAVLVVGGMLWLLGDSGDDGKPVTAPTTNGSLATSPPTTTRPTTSAPRPRSSTVHTSKTPSADSVVRCKGTPACRLPGDPGKAVAAVNAYRTSHGRKAVPGSVSRVAQTCAVNNGDGSSCPRSYFWEPVTGHDGKDVVAKIATKRDGTAFLLDPALKSIQVGWAYLPDSGGYECAIVNVY